jgi:HEAT repeat protein
MKRLATIPAIAAIILGALAIGSAAPDDLQKYIDALGSPYLAEREAARAALTEAGGVVFEPLAKSLDSENYFTRQYAAEIIEKIAAQEDAEKIAALLPKFIENYPEVAIPLMNSLERLKGREALPLLRNAIESQSSFVKVKAVEILGQIEDAESAEKIAAFLSAPSAELRCAAARALALIRAPKAGEEIFNALQKEEVTYAQIAFIDALGRLKYAAADEFLVAKIQDPSSPLFFASVNALAAIGSEKARDALIDLLMKAGDFEMLNLAAGAVAKLGAFAIPALNAKIPVTPTQDRIRILAAFSRMGVEAIPHIIKFMDEEPYFLWQDHAAASLRQMALKFYNENIRWGPYYDHPEKEKREDIERWKKWWAEKEKEAKIPSE